MTPEQSLITEALSSFFKNWLKEGESRVYMIVIGEREMEKISLIQAVAIPLKRWLRPYEALFYTGIAKSTFFRKCKEYGIHTNKNGYYDRNDLDLMLSGAPTKYETAARNIHIR